MNSFKFKNGYALGFEGQNKVFLPDSKMYHYCRTILNILYKDKWDGWINNFYNIDKTIPKYRFVSKKCLYQNIYKFKNWVEDK